jgi:hypothetical protein
MWAGVLRLPLPFFVLAPWPGQEDLKPVRKAAVVCEETSKAGMYIQATLFTGEPVISPSTARLP